MMAAPDLAGGGSVVEYSVHGRLGKNLIPPSGFRPESASAAQLDEYGFPPRPTDPTLLARRQDEMSGWTGAAPPTPFLAETHTQVTADTVNHPIWAGYAVTVEPGSISAFSHVEGWYYEPTFGVSRCTPTTEVTWAGLGGYYNPYNGGWLAQDGTAWNSNGADAHEAWWEIVPANNLTPINYYATPGVIMDVSVRVISGGFRFWFYNYAGPSMAFDESFTGSSNSLSAEVVVERPSVGGTPTNLANFQTLRVWQSEAWINGNVNGNTFDTVPANLNRSTGLWRHGLRPRTWRRRVAGNLVEPRAGCHRPRDDTSAESLAFTRSPFDPQGWRKSRCPGITIHLCVWPRRRPSRAWRSCWPAAARIPDIPGRRNQARRSRRQAATRRPRRSPGS